MASVLPASAAFEPLARLGVVLGHALAVLVQPARAEHGGRVACVGGLLQER
jgi:hypothetical protein